MGRTYTGFEGNSEGKRPGLEAFARLSRELFDHRLQIWQTWFVRPMISTGRPRPSIHGTGRAADLAWSPGFPDHAAATVVVDFWIAHADRLLIEEIHDYYPRSFGRGWRCDRSAWRVYDKQTIGVTGNCPGGRWFHVEIAPDHADDPDYYELAFADIRRGTSRRDEEPTNQEDRMLYIAMPKWEGVGDDEPHLVVCESGQIRRALNSDYAYAKMKDIPVIEQTSPEQHQYAIERYGI